MRVLVACEESQVVAIELRKLRHEAFSCDLLDCSGGHPEWHIKGNVLKQLNKNWDMMIAFPPCTHLAVSGAKHFKEKIKDGRQQQGVDFFMKFVNAPIKKICIENPIGIMSKIYRKPDQIIQPWQFGDEAQKTTCLWLRNLNKLEPTNIVSKGEMKEGVMKSGKKYRMPKWFSDNKSSTIRSKTFPGIAKAMAEQFTQPLKQLKFKL